MVRDKVEAREDVEVMARLIAAEGPERNRMRKVTEQVKSTMVF
jgi:hypothetical protein